MSTSAFAAAAATTPARVWTVLEDQLLYDLTHDQKISHDTHVKYPGVTWRHMASCMNELTSSRGIDKLQLYSALEVEMRYQKLGLLVDEREEQRQGQGGRFISSTAEEMAHVEGGVGGSGGGGGLGREEGENDGSGEGEDEDEDGDEVFQVEGLRKRERGALKERWGRETEKRGKRGKTRKAGKSRKK